MKFHLQFSGDLVFEGVDGGIKEASEKLKEEFTKNPDMWEKCIVNVDPED